MADHQHRAAGITAHLFDQAVKGGLAGLIQPLRRFIQDQQVRLCQKGARKQHTLELPARQVRHLPFRHLGNAHPCQGSRRGFRRMAARQRQKAARGHRQGAVDLQALRDIADAHPGAAADPARRQRRDPQKGAQQRGFTRPVRPDDGHDLARFDPQRDVVKHLGSTEAHTGMVRRDQAHAAVPVRQVGHRPSASILLRSIAKPRSLAA